MNMTNLIFIIIAYCCIAGIYGSIPFRRKKILTVCGQKELDFAKKPGMKPIIITVLSIVLIATLFFRDFGYAGFIIAGCAVLGVFLITKEAALLPLYGVYEKGIIASGTFIAFDDIVTFPVLNLPAEEQAHYAKNTLVVASAEKGNVELVFADEEECSKVVQLLREKKIIGEEKV